MVDLCPVVKWSSIQMVVWKRTEKSLFMVQNVQYLNVSPSHVTFPFEYRTPRLSVFKCSVFRWLLYLQPPELFRLWFPAVRTWPCLPRRWCRTSWPTHSLLLRHIRLQLPVETSNDIIVENGSVLKVLLLKVKLYSRHSVNGPLVTGNIQLADFWQSSNRMSYNYANPWIPVHTRVGMRCPLL